MRGMADTLEIIDLHAGIEGKEILKGVSLTVRTGEIHAVMGPNGSGKSTLAYTLMGHPKYKFISGDIRINGESIVGLPPNQRALKGLFLGFQYPLEIPGVSLANFLRISYNSLRKDEPMLVRDFRKLLEDKFELVGMERSFATRYLNEGFSGGEKKKAEVVQLAVLRPKFVPEDDGLRCAYHGWRFDAAGRCTEQPYEQAENPHSTFKDRISIKAYPVEELAGLIFAYLGPAPAPLLPRWDLFTLDAAVARDIGAAVIPCNWLQIVENSLDPVHVEWLHGHFKSYVFEKLGLAERTSFGKHERIGFSVFEYGILKRRRLEGEDEHDEDWATGHPLVFPGMLKSGSASHPTFQIRVPVDDAHTLHWWYTCHPPRPGQPVIQSDTIPYFDVPVPGVDATGEPEWPLLDNNSGQDIAMWITQGAVADREDEHLGASDRGVILYR